MDINDLRGIATLLCLIGFLAVVYWAYGPSRKSYFEEAAKLPFDDEALDDEALITRESKKQAEKVDE